VTALTFDPWEALKRKREDATPAKVANPANPTPHNPPRLADLAGLAGVPSPTHEIAIQDAAASSPPHLVSLPVVLDQEVQRMAEAMAANPVYRITNAETAMAYFRANALTRLTARRRERAANHRAAGV
jgi:hypothetical protein